MSVYDPTTGMGKSVEPNQSVKPNQKVLVKP
jgi:hypothetical protein